MESGRRATIMACCEVVIFFEHLHQRLRAPIIVIWDGLSAHDDHIGAIAAEPVLMRRPKAARITRSHVERPSHRRGKSHRVAAIARA
jgi:hypothetical protein